MEAILIGRPARTVDPHVLRQTPAGERQRRRAVDLDQPGGEARLGQGRGAAERKQEAFIVRRAARARQPRDDDVMGGRPEAIGVTDVEEAAEKIGRGERRAAARRERDGARARGDRRRALAQAGEVETRLDDARRLVDQRQARAVQALIGQHDAQRPEGALERAPDRLRPAQMIEKAPARARREGVAQHQRNRAFGRRAMRAPTRDHLLRDLAGDGARKGEIAGRIFAAQRGGIEIVEGAQIAIAHALEPPDRAGVALDPGAEDGLGDAGLVERRIVIGNVVEAEPLRRETRARQNRVVEAALIGADAVIMHDALMRDEGQFAAPGRVRQIGAIGPAPRGGGGQNLVEDRVRPYLARQAEHGGLLGDLGAAAQRDKGGRGAGRVEKILRLGGDLGAKSGVVGGIIEISEGEILPDHQAKLVADLVEGARLGKERPGDAHHVHAGAGHRGEARAQRLGALRGPRQIGRNPDRAAREDGDAVDEKAKALAILAAVDRDAAKAEAARLDLAAVQRDAGFVQRGIAMRSRPPRRDVGQPQGEPRAPVRVEPGPRRAAGDGEDDFACGGALQRIGRDVAGHDADIAVERGRERGARRKIGRRDQLDRPPRADDAGFGRPAGNAAELGLTQIAQARLFDRALAPAPAALEPVEDAAHGAKADRQPRAAGQRHSRLIAAKHVAGLKEQRVIEKNIGDPRQPGEAQRMRALAGDVGDPPEIGEIEITGMVRVEFAARGERGGDGRLAGLEAGAGGEVAGAARGVGRGFDETPAREPRHARRSSAANTRSHVATIGSASAAASCARRRASRRASFICAILASAARSRAAAAASTKSSSQSR